VTTNRVAILDVLNRNRHEIVNIGQIIAETGLKLAQVQQTIYLMRRTNPALEEQIEVVIRGRAWRFNPLSKDALIGQRASNNGYVANVPTTRYYDDTTSVAVPTPYQSAAPVHVGGTSSPRLFEEIGTSGDDVIVCDEQNKLYKLVPIE
jgi:hypothetical protein